MKLLLILVIFFLKSVGICQEKKEVLEATDKSIVIGSFDAPMLSLNKQEYLKKLIIRTLAKQQVYHLVIRDEELSEKLEKLNSVEVKISGSINKNFKVSASITELSSQKIIKKVSADQIPYDEINRKVEILIEILFDIRKKKVANKKKQVTPAVNAIKIVKNKINSSATPFPPPATINFRERILSLKKNIEDEFSRNKIDQEDKKKKLEGSENAPSSNSNSQATIETQQNAIDNKKSSIKNDLYTLDYSFAAGLSTLSTNSINREETLAEVSLSDTLNFLTLTASMSIEFSHFNFLQTYLSFTNRRPISLNPDYELSPLINSEYGFNSKLIFNKFKFNIFILSEQTPFASIPQAGRGIFISVYEVSYLGLGMTFNYNQKHSLGSKTFILNDSKGVINTPTSKLTQAQKFEFFYQYNLSAFIQNSSLFLSYAKQSFKAQDENLINFSFDQNAIEARMIFLF